LDPPVVVVPLLRLDRVAREALRFGMAISPDVEAVQVLAEDMDAENLSADWERLVAEPARRARLEPARLTVLPSPYREFFGPLLEHVAQLTRAHRGRYVAVVVPELFERRWYHRLVPHRASL